MSLEQGGVVKFVMYQDCVSPHQIPLARELVLLLGMDNFRYVYRDLTQTGRTDIGWAMKGSASWFVHIGTTPNEAKALIESADCLLTMFRDIYLIRRRYERGLMTIVQTERWFKPKVGILRLLLPPYWRMAKAFVRLMDDGGMNYLPMGMHAARDMARLCGLMHGDLRCLFRAPRLEFERRPGGRIWVKDEPRNTRNTRKFCLEKMRMWGYFVRSSEFGVKSSELNEESTNQTHNSQLTTHNSLRVLWVGRFLDWKRVDTIIRAVGELSCSRLTTNNYRLTTTLDIYGTGPEEERLKNLSAKYGDVINFHPPVPIAEVRRLMREHDVYVLSSNAYEGWGAVVSEALEEGMRVLGTYEAGSSATILPKERLFHSGDYKALAALLEKESRGDLPPCSIGDWTAKFAAERLLELAE